MKNVLFSVLDKEHTMEKRHGEVISKTGLIIGLLSLSLVALAGQAHAAIQCYDCHGDRTAGILKPKDTYSNMSTQKQRDPSTGAFLGNHGTHLGSNPAPSDCVKCHNNQNYTSSHATLGNNQIQISPKLNNFSSAYGRARYAKSTFFNQTSVPQTATCSNVNCHFVSKPTDKWGTQPYAAASATTCNKCHDALPASNAHTKHVTFLGGTINVCATCHNNYPSAAKPFQHATSAGTRPIGVSLGNYSGSYSGGNTSYLPGLTGRIVGSCNNVYCHSSGQSLTDPISKTPTYKPVSWGSTEGACSTEFCHPTTKTTVVSGSHGKHLAASGIGCSNCHVGVAADGSSYSSPNHLNKQIDVDTTLTYSAAGARGNGYGTCSTASCHNNGTGTPGVTPTWGTSVAACSACHALVPSTGAHTKHLVTTTFHKPVCADCHKGAVQGTTAPAGHLNGTVDVFANITGDLGYPSHVALHPAGTYVGTCSTAYCHSSGQSLTSGSSAVPTYKPVSWGQTSGTCSTEFCHPTQKTTVVSGSHAKHLASFTCADCHTGVAADISSYNSLSHVDGNIDVATFMSYSGGGAPGNGYKSCSTASCHDNGRGVAVKTPTWGTSVPSCTACHALQPATGSHTKHLTGLVAYNRSAVCGDCHGSTVQGVSAEPQHLNGNVDVYKTTPGDLGYPTTVPKHNNNNFNSCTAVWCHSNGKGTYASETWNNPNTSGCNFCHPIANLSLGHGKHVATVPTAYGSTANNSTDAAYDFGCGNCHPIVTSNHMNGTIDLTLNRTHGGPLKSKNNVADDISGYTRGVNSATCSAAYCHSTGFTANIRFITSPDWYVAFTGDRCAMCHGNSPNSDSVNRPGSPAHNAHAVGIHYDDIYNGVSGKYGYYSSATKPSAHGDPNQATIISCDICHSNTVATDPAGKNANDKNSICVTCHSAKSRVPTIKRAAHVNGSVDVIFAAVNVRSKAQIRDASFSSYSAVWARTTYKVDSGSYDTAKKSLNQATFNVGASAGQGTCATVSCHNGYTVKWSDTVNCDSCHSRL